MTLTILVVTGVTTRLDRYAVVNWMPWLRPGSTSLLDVRSLLVPVGSGTVAHRLVDLWTYPASFVVSGLIVGVCAFALRRRRRRTALRLALAWCAGNMIELIGKTTITRPSLAATHHGRLVPHGLFSNSYPSGHTIRGALVAAALACVWRHARRPLAVWALSLPVALVLLGEHTPSDVAGSLLVAVVLLSTAIEPKSSEGPAIVPRMAMTRYLRGRSAPARRRLTRS